jgi:ketol-acid reductoisomerase
LTVSDPYPTIVVAPGSEGAAVSWQFRSDCGVQELAAAQQQARVADRHDTVAHGGAGTVSRSSIGAV